MLDEELVAYNLLDTGIIYVITIQHKLAPVLECFKRLLAVHTRGCLGGDAAQSNLPGGT